MASKKKTAETTQATITAAAAPAPAPAAAPGSALGALMALGAKKQAPATASTIVQSLTDPAIQGASKTGSIVKLGFDPSIAEKAKNCAALKEALENAESAFATLQGDMRDYGASKRVRYNDLFKSDAVTVAVPYEVQTPAGIEKKFVQVICTNKYSCSQDIIKGNKETLGEFYPRLFEETETKTLKPNAEELIRNLLTEMGLTGEQLDNTMDNLREVRVSVKAKDGYEQEARNVPEAIKTILDQGVKRQQPALKFPG
jgi:hypothetical protein